VNAAKLDRRRAVGKLVNLSDLLVHEPLAGKAGIGHTRWATHGAATVKNAHPHRAGGSRWCITASSRTSATCAPSWPPTAIFSGIRDRYRDRRPSATRDGPGAKPGRAARATLKRLHGAFALCFLFDGEDDLMIAARKGSPLAIGHGEGEMFVGSDAIALAPMTDRITYLEEGDWAVVTRAGAEIFDAANRRANRAETRIQVDATRIEKAGYKHFMAKEIAEQPVVIADALKHYRHRARRHAEPARKARFHRHRPGDLVACGTASMPAMSRNTGSSRSPACPPTSTSRPSSATATRCCRPPRWRSSSASRARPPTRWPRCAM
jgi:glucosamine--fructose-6-phosphate aminotransferase (isomerizing)